jgi:hypothetical protein
MHFLKCVLYRYFIIQVFPDLDAPTSTTEIAPFVGSVGLNFFDGKDFLNVYNFYMGCYSGKNITYYQKVNMTYKNVHFAMYFLDGKAD